MGILYVALVSVYVIVCFFLILVVLVQQGRGADLAGAFGGGGTQTAFGARGATTLLHKLTTIGFIAFIAVALAMTLLEARPRASVVPEKGPARKAAAPLPIPAVPQPAPANQGPAAQSAPPAQNGASPAQSNPTPPKR